MAKVNGCLRYFFIIFNVVFAIVGCVLVLGTVKVTAYSHQVPDMGTPNLGWMWVFSIGVLGISCLGIYAGYTEKLLPLKIFAGFVAGGMVIMLILGTLMVIGSGKILGAIHLTAFDSPPTIMQDQSMRELLDELQLEGHCCGVWRTTDWGDTIPDSCNCTYATEGLDFIGLGTSGCKARPYGTDGPEEIYPRTCGNVILQVLHFIFQLVIGIFFGLAAAALLDLLLSYLIIRKVKGHDGSGEVGVPMKSQYL